MALSILKIENKKLFGKWGNCSRHPVVSPRRKSDSVTESIRGFHAEEVAPFANREIGQGIANLAAGIPDDGCLRSRVLY
jgi:hypothetical protein